MYLRLFFLILGCSAFSTAVRHQAVAIKGKLLCGSAPARNVRVKLWEEDSGPDPDDLLDQGYTDAQGMFSLKGDTAELTPIDPVFKVYHDCDDGLKPGQRKVKFKIPASYVTEGKIAKKTFDIGVLNLETIFASQGSLNGQTLGFGRGYQMLSRFQFYPAGNGSTCTLLYLKRDSKVHEEREMITS